MISSRTQNSNLAKQQSKGETIISPMAHEIMERVNSVAYDRKTIPQEDLDLANKFRASLFPWRGQFSPELIELFLDCYSQQTSVLLDPFVGSGTTLFEAARKNIACYGAELNPSAIEMARTVQFATIPLLERKRFIQIAMNLAEKYTRPFIRDLFSYQEDIPTSLLYSTTSVEEQFTGMLQEAGDNSFVHNLLANSIMRYMSYPLSRTASEVIRAVYEHAKIVESIPFSNNTCKVFHADARVIPLTEERIDLIITSPPYINVFNYHQNHRPAMELIGWNLLDIARSEIGSNRKHRQNRFLTVIQYALDMFDVLREIKRLLRPNGRAIFVVGRESNVRGVSFPNGMLVAALALGANFQLEMLQERKFTNKFGETIYEDILHLIPDPTAKCVEANYARSIALWSLLEGSNAASGQIKDEILQAIERANVVQPSPLFTASADTQNVGHDDKQNGNL